MDNNYIDELVRDSIGEYEMAFDPADWDAMEEHLETDNRVRRKLYTTKAIEACLMLLTVWTIMQFVEIDNSAHYQPTVIEHQEKTPPTVDEEKTLPLKVNEKKQNESLEDSRKRIQKEINENPLLKNVPIANNVLKNLETIPMENQAKGNDEIIPINNNTESNTIDFKKIIDENNSIPIASLAPKMFDVSDKVFLQPIDLGLDQEGSMESQKTRKYRIAGSFGTNIFNKSNQLDELVYTSQADMPANNTLYNVLGGVTVDRKIKKKLRIETGAILAYQKSQAANSSIGLGSYNQNTSIINTSSIEIPVNVLYEICNNEKNALYALGGLSNYLRLSVKEHSYYDVNQSNMTTQMDPNLSNAPEKIDGLLITKEMPDNHYASVNVGAGYERKLNKRLSLFAQATLKKSFGKIGFNEDETMAISLSTGVKSIL